MKLKTIFFTVFMLIISVNAYAQSKGGGFLYKSYLLQKQQNEQKRQEQLRQEQLRQEQLRQQQLRQQQMQLQQLQQQQMQYQQQNSGGGLYNNTGHFVGETPEQAEQWRQIKESARQSANRAYSEAYNEVQHSSSRSQSVDKARFNKDIDREVKAYNNAHQKGATGSDILYYQNIKKNNQIRYGTK